MSTWFISDPHFGHKNVISYENRPFVDTVEMDEVIIANCNDTLKDNDIVFWLGDMFFCNSSRIEYIVSKLRPTRNILIRGNHDKGVGDSKFKKLGFLPYKMYSFNGHILTHQPVSEVNMDYLASVGVYTNIHGHTHSRDMGLDPTIYQCVSVELINYTPIEYFELLDRFDAALFPPV